MTLCWRYRKKPPFVQGHWADDADLKKRMRVLAVYFQTDGRARLRLPKGLPKALRRALDEISHMAACSPAPTEAMEHFRQDMRTLETMCMQAALDGGARLPARGGVPRVLALVREAVTAGECSIDRERLILALEAFQAVQPLTMAEIWAVPTALRITLAENCLALAENVRNVASSRMCAEGWAAEDGKTRLPEKTSAFFARALQLTVDRELPRMRAALEEALSRRGETAETIVRNDHEAQAVYSMRLTNLVKSRFALDEMRWETCFSELSRVENELMLDPAKVYPEMDDESREAVRKNIERLARRADVAEAVVARRAVLAARSAKDEERKNVCRWLYTDEGLRETATILGVKGAIGFRMTPDPGAKLYISAFFAVFFTVFAVFCGLAESFLFFLPAIPLAWCAAKAAVTKIALRLVRPKPLLKLKSETEDGRMYSSVPTLVVVPALLSSMERAQKLADELESLGCLDKDPNTRYLLLGDFRDCETKYAADDRAILDAVRTRIRRMNAEFGAEKFYYLHRERTYYAPDGRWMGHERKRGALMALNRLLLGEQDAETVFSAEGAACEKLAGRFPFVCTLDADTRLLPGTVQKLSQTLAHPINRPRTLHGRRVGFAILQPDMEPALAGQNRYAALFGGAGGVDAYPVHVSDLYQDLTGLASFGGKGLYDVRAVMDALEKALPDGRILSHDLIEGELARTGFVSDVAFYDGFPEKLSKTLSRTHRWTRGDWQLLPDIFSRRVYSRAAGRLSFLSRFKMLDNLVSSLFLPALLAVLVQGVWLHAPAAFSLAVVLAFLEPLINLFSAKKDDWSRALAKFMALPCEAACRMDAIWRTLWRLAFTRRHMLDWVTSADSTGGLKAGTFSCMAAILLLPGLFSAAWAAPALALAALFLLAPAAFRDLEEMPPVPFEPLKREDAHFLYELARDTWSFFETYVDRSTNFLPPDNVQVDPPVGAAGRTSPTNIGLYMVSAVAAHSFGFLNEEDCLRRLKNTLSTLQTLETWKGQLYNWYDVYTLRPLRPLYVSAVDSGNLAACLLACAASVRGMDAELSRNLRVFAEQMDLSALYDRERDLFYIGMDAESGQMSRSHYDLYASEARILSYVSMMMGQTPVRHWKALSRAMVRFSGGQALISWSGTMFEYLMPALLLQAPAGSLAERTNCAVVKRQILEAEGVSRPWGVSESGYYAFDLDLNYQYRAFGLRTLALSGNAMQKVIAPYASALALASEPRAAAKNLKMMAGMGLRGVFGLFEAVDFMAEADGSPSVVKSYMAHHQGMTLCALANVLCRKKPLTAFSGLPEARALSLLLEEKPVAKLHIPRRAGMPLRRPARMIASEGYARTARTENRLVDAHILSGGETTFFLTARGDTAYCRKGVMLDRFPEDILTRREGMALCLRDAASGETCLLSCAEKGVSCVFDAGHARFSAEFAGLLAVLTVSVSPEDGAVLQEVELTNRTGILRKVEATSLFKVSLARPQDFAAHPAFQKLFVTSRREGKNALVFSRRQAAPGNHVLSGVHLASGAALTDWETDLSRFLGREGDFLRPETWKNLTQTVGETLDPCSVLRVECTIAPSETVRFHFAAGLTEEENVPVWLERNASRLAPERAVRLGGARARAALRFAGVGREMHGLFHRASALLFDPHLHLGCDEDVLCPKEDTDTSGEDAKRLHTGAPCPRENLWAAGISGDVPIVLVRVENQSGLPVAREAVRMHAFYHSMGVTVDLVLLNEYGNDYEQPVRDALRDMIAASHLNHLRGVPGGVHLPEGKQLSPVQKEALLCTARMIFSGSTPFAAQLRGILQTLELARSKEHLPMQARPQTGADRGEFFNGYGSFVPNEPAYRIALAKDSMPPAPWVNVLAGRGVSCVLSERGGGFFFGGNSRLARVTNFVNDALHEGWGLMAYLTDEARGEYVRLLPGKTPMTDFCVTHAPEGSTFTGAVAGAAFETAASASPAGLLVTVTVKNTLSRACEMGVTLFCDWLMGADGRDAACLKTWSNNGAIFAAGAMAKTGFLAAVRDVSAVNGANGTHGMTFPGANRTDFLGYGGVEDPDGLFARRGGTGGWTLKTVFKLAPGETRKLRFVLGLAENAEEAEKIAAELRGENGDKLLQTEKYLCGTKLVSSETNIPLSADDWHKFLGELRFETPDKALDRLLNGFLPRQVLSSRVLARAGFYQAGGAYGFRDQLQDVLALLPYAPEITRRHILFAAQRQFEAGDVLHWWHEPATGVRTHITDDCLFLPFVTAKYVQATGDREILHESLPFLQDEPIPEGQKDLYFAARPTNYGKPLHEHCMRVFRRAGSAERIGCHGLCLMGGGDWNDGMDLVGARGRGESVWLSEFLAVCCLEYAELCPSEEDRAFLLALAERMKKAVEEHGWDGKWYLRAYDDDGEPLGSAQNAACRIDAIAQGWAALAGLSKERVQTALNSAWEELVDEENGIIRLLTPPFDGNCKSPGYILGYPPGVRENGGQYTHGACWLILGLIHAGEAERAQKALSMLNPIRHSLTKEQADLYRTEPYAVAADVYAEPPHTGRGGWTWYTGAAGWMLQCALALLGYERRGDRVRLSARLGDWPEAALTVREGGASYKLVARKDVKTVTMDGREVPDGWIALADDGREHEAVFPPKKV